ncbi:hypothetical protein LTR56_006032 [Elasticomyces elasticus]|nr:hypothetical protein LTR56_006032 [Elasticomyces elasticus]KAK3669006.1 hypothetical protein LTR22_000085 [Elasticomyces elasticus]KAK4922694.1 hypothetical protein LTR49_010050 [Elasticomyces elasticus]KAK5760949.1 hypothetical protein LTS12_008953 [Elasticomyces elasticus]
MSGQTYRWPENGTAPLSPSITSQELVPAGQQVAQAVVTPPAQQRLVKKGVSLIGKTDETPLGWFASFNDPDFWRVLIPEIGLVGRTVLAATSAMYDVVHTFAGTILPSRYSPAAEPGMCLQMFFDQGLCVTTVQILGRNMATALQFAQSLAAAQQIGCGKDCRNIVAALDIMSCPFLDEVTVLGLGRVFPNLKYLTVCDCLQFDLRWAIG